MSNANYFPKMSLKTGSVISKSTCSTLTRHSKKHSAKSDKSSILKKVIISKKILEDGKCFSTGGISNAKNTVIVKPKKTTKSDLTFIRKAFSKNNNPIDYCKKCGDAIDNAHVPATSNSSGKTTIQRDKDRRQEREKDNKALIQNAKQPKSVKTNKSVQQYYKNEHFQQSTASIHNIDNGIKKISLDPIKEVSEHHSKSDLHSNSTIFKVYSDSDDEIGFLDPDKSENISKLKEFRLNNYFECHSAKSRIKNKGSVISLQDHKCVYRFYLNERLFPVPLSADFKNTIRCVECNLPMDVKNEINGRKSDEINGTIQAKVKLGDNLQDMTLLLPVKETMVIKERKKDVKNAEDVVYFGVIKLQSNGNSVFNETLPNNSLALKYQKGYKEIGNCNYRYESIEKDDIIVI